MPTAGGQPRSPLEQMLEVMTNKEMYAQAIQDFQRAKSEAEDAVMALGNREATLEQKLREVSDREASVARREALVDGREKAIAEATETAKQRNARWKVLIPQIKELL